MKHLNKYIRKLLFVVGLTLIGWHYCPLNVSAEISQESLVDRPQPTSDKVTDINLLTKYNLLKGSKFRAYFYDKVWEYGSIDQDNNILNRSYQPLGSLKKFDDISFSFMVNGNSKMLMVARTFLVKPGHEYQVSYSLKNASYDPLYPLTLNMAIVPGSTFGGIPYKTLPNTFDTMMYQNFKVDIETAKEASYTVNMNSIQVYQGIISTNTTIIDLNQNIIEARRDVEKLFTDNTYTKLKEFVTQKELDSVKKTVDLVVNSTERTFLLQYTELAQKFLDDVQMTLTTTEINDNIESLNNKEVKGTTYPHAYVRITGKTSLPTASLLSPFKDDPKNFTIQADELGNYTVRLENDEHFIAGEKIVVEANRHGKQAIENVVVKDKTPPKGEAKSIHSILKDAIPTPDKFVTDLNDSNPNNKKITAEYSTKNNSDQLQQMMQKSGTYTVYVMIKDEASNSTEIQSELIVYDSNSLLESTDFQMDQEELLSFSNEEMANHFLRRSQTQAYLIKDTNKIDLTDKLQLRGLDTFKKELGSYTLSYFLSKEDSGLTIDLTSEFIVTVTQPDASKPVEPTNPQPETSVDAENEGTGNKGYLRMDYAPSIFDFGKLKTSFLNKTYQAKQPLSVSGKPLTRQWVQVSDTRSSSNGWTLSVHQSTPFVGSDGSTLKGAILRIPKGTIYNTLSNEIPVSDTSIISHEISLSETPTAILATPKNKNRGKKITTNVWNPSQVTLYVPSGSAKNKVHYQTTVNWSLMTDVPN